MVQIESLLFVKERESLFRAQPHIYIQLYTHLVACCGPTFYFAPVSACNYGKGKWVNDDNRPLYSGSGCKQWLSGMWACRLTQRTDFAYEKLRWQPKDCEMDDFTGSKFLMRYYFSILLTLRKVYIQNTVALIFHMGVLA